MMRIFRILKSLISEDENFLHGLEIIEGWVSKILSIGMILVTFIAIFQLGYSLYETLVETIYQHNQASFNAELFQLFGLFLNVLIALEILENITAYLKKHVVQVELVLVTSLIAVSRKIIILDLEKKDSNDLIALAVAVFSLSISYLLIRQANSKNH
ncbi:phosphate-starvation-inducible PsiE family protein [Chamaesiphon sp. VAR_48_metabat_135_sub]|uniref:phosphate-starvation-inducible PsiE family protein n=1 Tax=Chamaesiphon sp. VAR_48_metabat_135_sub TaxID=2964699 RepID=UPI0037BF2A82